MPIATTVSVLVLALGLEAAFGYPHAIYKRIGHPATWLGALISTLDGALNRAHQSAGLRRTAGVLTLVIIVAIPAGIAWFIERALVSDWAGNLVLAVLASMLLASRSLYVHVRDVAGALETGSIIAARSAVSRIVGRRSASARRARRRAGGDRKPYRERLRWRRGTGLLVPRARSAGPRSLQSDQHRRQHDRPPQPPSRGVRLGGGAVRRSGQSAAVATDGIAVRGGGAPCSRDFGARRASGNGARRKSAPLAQCRLAGKRDGRCAGFEAQWAEELCTASSSTTPTWVTVGAKRRRKIFATRCGSRVRPGPSWWRHF